MTQNWAGPWFIKPADIKVFDAAVYAAIQDSAFNDLDPTTPILISEPVEFSQEWRFFLGHRKVRACSIYARDGQPFEGWWSWDGSEEREARAFVQTLVDDPLVFMLPSMVIDVGKVGNVWLVIETNDSYASGIYGCDPRGVLEALACAD